MCKQTRTKDHTICDIELGNNPVDKETQKEKQWLVWSDYMLKPICVVCGKIQDSKESEFIDMLTKGPPLIMVLMNVISAAVPHDG